MIKFFIVFVKRLLLVVNLKLLSDKYFSVMVRFVCLLVLGSEWESVIDVVYFVVILKMLFKFE